MIHFALWLVVLFAYNQKSSENENKEQVKKQQQPIKTLKKIHCDLDSIDF